jgi:hypothetical protein
MFCSSGAVREVPKKAIFNLLKKIKNRFFSAFFWSGGRFKAQIIMIHLPASKQQTA